jgi:5-methylcytosine-specific restriction endonuclease McrA
MSKRRNSNVETRMSGTVKLCQICDKPAVIRGLYCSEEHAHEFRVKSNEQYRRLKVFERDCGICATTGLDCVRIDKVRRAANSSWRKFKLCKGKKQRWRSDAEAMEISERYVNIWKRMILRLEIPQHLWVSGPLWYADHILPVNRDGGECSLENLQTLSWKPHQEKTNAEAKGRKLLGNNKMDNVLKMRQKL